MVFSGKKKKPPSLTLGGLFLDGFIWTRF